MAADLPVTVGWDIGGVNVKAVRAEWRDDRVVLGPVVIRPFEVWRDRDALPGVLAEVAGRLGLPCAAPMAVTMTAELSDAFRDKREGVTFVSGAVGAAFPEHSLFAVDVQGELAPLDETFDRPLEFAATNWVAAARHVAARWPDCILVDMGSTTTDIVPIRGGRVDSVGRTDLTRLAAGELVYTGLLRTDPAVLASDVPVAGHPCRVSAERFALMADVHLLLGAIEPEDYTCPTADGRGVSRRECEERLARLVCADRESLGEGDVLTIARYLAERQVQVVVEGLFQVVSRLGNVEGLGVLAVGIGQRVVEKAAARVPLPVIRDDGAPAAERRALPACAAAALLAARLAAGP
jgi:probable H4MPT-linked C1 transfer pathway protein